MRHADDTCHDIIFADDGAADASAMLMLLMPMRFCYACYLMLIFAVSPASPPLRRFDSLRCCRYFAIDADCDDRDARYADAYAYFARCADADAAATRRCRQLIDAAAADERRSCRFFFFFSRFSDAPCCR